VQALLDRLVESPRFERLLGTPGPKVARVPDVGQPFAAAALARAVDAPVLVVAPGHGEAERIASGAELFLPDRVALFPAWEALPYEGISPGPEVAGRRAFALHAARAATGPFLLVAPVAAAMQALVPTLGAAEPLRLEPGMDLAPDALAERLVALGYGRTDLVEHRGEFAVRGGIVDVFPANGARPVRVEYFGDEIESLRTFTASTQVTTATVKFADLWACRELVPTDEIRERAAAEAPRHLGRFREALARVSEGLSFEGMEIVAPIVFDELPSLADCLPKETWVAVAASRRTADRAALILREADALAEAQDWPAARVVRSLETSLGLRPRVDLSELAEGDALGIEPWAPAAGKREQLVKQAKELTGQGFTLVLTAAGHGSLERMRELVGDAELATESQTGRGFVFPAGKLAVLGEEDLFGARRATRHEARLTRRRREQFVLDLSPGDYVVHLVHGVARYGGMVRRDLAGAERDYLLLEYAHGDRLYVPTDMVGWVSKYLGGESPRLSRLGTDQWSKTKNRVRRAVRDMAGELVRLYSVRMSVPGHAFSPDTPWQRELEDAFPHTETPDQATTIDEVKRDMESDRPMDRLVCGDVGYGKTEIAVRSAFKAVMDGKQVAVLVPTTLLAEQHFQTFSERYAPFPVKVAMLSRFLSAAEQKRVLADLAAGKVDVIIGTHRLLSQDAKFKDLGLLVVDEEQRFGVAHKERLKKIRASVDVLTMTATPIPRTLEMALTGVREISVVDTPPEDRQPILTYVGAYDEGQAVAAVRRELLRDGQVFWVHNQIRTIDGVARTIQEKVPDARVVVAHGQMDEALLEKQMIRFWDREADVLVCTTIIESGLDVPTANTLVVDRADKLGLAQLYQLRGRVGRSSERAFSYFFFPRQRALTEEAHARLATISEHTALGSGFRIALRDLEIRGAGNLLGAEQHGHIAAVGFDTYVRLLQEAVAEMQGEPLPERKEIRVDLPVKAFLPVDYVGSEPLRLELYRRISDPTNHEELAEIRAELEDRFGDVPEEVESLLELVGLRLTAERVGVEEIATLRGQVRVKPVRFRAEEGGADAAARVAGATYRPATATLNLIAALRGPELIRYVRRTLEALEPVLEPAIESPGRSQEAPV
jgi:transcription-repair coupling factor (superfamily II helicase)